MFWRIFKAAWKDSFTPKNIMSAFEKPGIWPVASEKMVEKTRHSRLITPPDHLFQDQKTPIICKAIRRVHRLYKANPTT